MAVNAAYRCTHGPVRRLVTVGTLGRVGKVVTLGILGKMGTRKIKLSIAVNYVHIHIYRVIPI